MRNWIADKFGRNRRALPVMRNAITAIPTPVPVENTTSNETGTILYTSRFLRNIVYSNLYAYSIVWNELYAPQHPAHVRLPDGI